MKMSSETGSKDTIALRDAAVVGPMHKLGKIDTTIPVYPPDGTPQAGARRMEGKFNMPTATLRTGLQPSAVAVRLAAEVAGAARKQINSQVAGDDTFSP